MGYDQSADDRRYDRALNETPSAGESERQLRQELGKAKVALLQQSRILDDLNKARVGNFEQAIAFLLYWLLMPLHAVFFLMLVIGWGWRDLIFAPLSDTRNGYRHRRWTRGPQRQS